VAGETGMKMIIGFRAGKRSYIAGQAGVEGATHFFGWYFESDINVYGHLESVDASVSAARRDGAYKFAQRRERFLEHALNRAFTLGLGLPSRKIRAVPLEV
jgi:hypothetical protein